MDLTYIIQRNTLPLSLPYTVLCCTSGTRLLQDKTEDKTEDSPPPPSQGGAQPKKTLPRPVYEGDAAALVETLLEAAKEGEEPDIAKVRELLDAGIDVRYQVREP